MKKYLLIPIIFFGSLAFATKPEKDLKILDIMPLQLQVRYEDSVDQSKQMQMYKGLLGFSIFEFNAAFQFNDYRWTFGRSYQSETTGNSTLEIEKLRYEYLLGAGYQVYQLSSQTKKAQLSIFVNGYYGLTRGETKTKFFNATTKSESEFDSVSGVGATVTGRFFKYLIAETDVKILNSMNYSPQIVPLVTIRVGGSIYF